MKKVYLLVFIGAQDLNIRHRYFSSLVKAENYRKKLTEYALYFGYDLTESDFDIEEHDVDAE